MNQQLREKFFDRFLSTSRQRIAAVQAFVRAGDAASVRAEFHTLAGEASMLGFEEVANVARDAEAQAVTWVEGDAKRRVPCGRAARSISRILDTLTPAATPSAASISKVDVENETMRPWRVLIIDDSELAADQLIESLEDHQISARWAADADAAMAACRDVSPRLVLLDLHMPGLDPADMCARLKQVPTGPSIFLVSGISQEELEKRQRELGADGSISKNAGSNEIVQQVRRVLDGAA